MDLASSKKKAPAKKMPMGKKGGGKGSKNC